MGRELAVFRGKAICCSDVMGENVCKARRVMACEERSVDLAVENQLVMGLCKKGGVVVVPPYRAPNRLGQLLELEESLLISSKDLELPTGKCGSLCGRRGLDGHKKMVKFVRC